MGWGDDTSLNLSVVQNGNGLRMLTTQESHAFKRVECQVFFTMGKKETLYLSIKIYQVYDKIEKNQSICGFRID
jgi:hypothetical protein